MPLRAVFASEPENVVLTALEECAKDYQVERENTAREDVWITGALDNYLGNSNVTDFVRELTSKIQELGFTIIAP